MNIVKQMELLLRAQFIADSFLLPYRFIKKQDALKKFQHSKYNQNLIFNYGAISPDSDYIFMISKSLLNSFDNVEVFKKNLLKKLTMWLLTIPVVSDFSNVKSVICHLVNKNDTLKHGTSSSMIRVPIISLYYKNNYLKRNEFIKAATEITHNNETTIIVNQSLGNLVSHLALYNKLPEITELKRILTQEIEANKRWDKYINILVHNLEQNTQWEEFIKKLTTKKHLPDDIVKNAICSLFLLYKSQNIEVLKLIISCSGNTNTIGSFVMACLSLLVQDDLLKNNTSLNNYFPPLPELKKHYIFDDTKSFDSIPKVEKSNVNNIYFSFLWLKIFFKNLLFSPIFLYCTIKNRIIN